jgi:mono/diheme cytochrome c family protein
MRGMANALCNIVMMVIWLGVLQGCGLVSGQPDQSELQNGKRLYEKRCMVCHGRQGKGDGYREFDPPPADLTSQTVQEKLDADLLKTILEGHPNTAMKKWNVVLSSEESHEVLAYVRSLSW